MIELKTEQAEKILNAHIEGDHTSFKGVSFDSRSIVPGNLFIALQGEHANGHMFIEQAEQAGAVAVLVRQPAKTKLTQIIVEDTLHAMTQLAQYWREQFHIPFLAVTGSNGKTTIKTMLAAICKEAVKQHEEKVLVPIKNYNNHLGVPFTLLQLNIEHEYAVIEMGMNHLGEIAHLTKLVKPNVAIISNAGPSHLEGVGDVFDVAKAKGEIFQGLQKDGVAIINADDEYANYWKDLTKNHEQYTFGIDQSSDVSASFVNEKNIHSHSKSCFILKTIKQEVEIVLPLPGRHNVMNALAATAASLAIGIDIHTIKKALEQLQGVPGRMQLKKGMNDIELIDDTYNANPLSYDAAIQVLAKYPGRKILVIGDMKELGANENRFHEQAGYLAKEEKIDRVFALGDLTKHLVHAFGKGAEQFSCHDDLIQSLKQYLQAGDQVLIKGSRSMQMEKVVCALES